MDLINRSRLGDQTALAALFEQYKNLVYRTAFLMLDDASEADDALQEVFLKAFGALHSYRPEKAAFSTWLYRITVNHCLNRRRSRAFTFLPLRRAPADHRALRTSAPEEQVSLEDETWRAMRRLSDKLRLVLILRFYHELSYAEIAEILDVPMGTVQSRLKLALDALRKNLMDTYDLLPDRLRPEGGEESLR